METFGERLKGLREGRELTQKEFSLLIRCKPSFVSQMENGTKMPNQLRLERIATVFGVTETWLLTGQGDTYHEKSNVIPIREGQVADPRSAKSVPDLETDKAALEEIYGYQDRHIINAIHANLVTFVRTVRREQEAERLKQQVSELQEEQKKMNEVIGRIENQIKAQVEEEEKKNTECQVYKLIRRPPVTLKGSFFARIKQRCSRYKIACVEHLGNVVHILKFTVRTGELNVCCG